MLNHTKILQITNYIKKEEGRRKKEEERRGKKEEGRKKVDYRKIRFKASPLKEKKEKKFTTVSILFFLRRGNN